MTNIGEMQASAANGSENAASGGVASVYDWDNPAFKENPTATENFRLSVNIAYDLGINGKLYADTIERLTQLGAVRSLTPDNKPLGRKQSNPDNPTGTITRGHGFFMPPRVALAGQCDHESDVMAAIEQHTVDPDGFEAVTDELFQQVDAGDALSEVPAFVERGEDGQVVEREVGRYVGTDATLTFNLNFGDEVATVEPTTTPPEPMETPVIAEQGAEDYVGARVEPDALGRVVKPSYLHQRNPAIVAAVNRMHGLGCSEALVAAVSYAGIGLRSFPLVAGGKTPAGANGFKVATSEVSQLVNWFDDGEFFQRSPHHDKNLGIATGETDGDFDLVVLDVDVKDGKDGLLVFGGAEGEFGKLPATLMASTPSGGLHYLYKAPKGSDIGCGVNVFKQHGEGLDIRCNGGYIAASPSEVNGKPYQWLNDLLPVWLSDSWIKAFQAECPVGGKRGAVSGSGNGDGERVTRGELSPMPDDVALAIAERAVPSDVERTDWLKVLSVLSAFVSGEALARHWSSTGNYAKHFNDADFDKAWDEVHSGFNDGEPMRVGVLFNLVKEHSPEWQTPAARHKAAEEAAAAAQREAARVDTFGVMPEHLLNSLHHQKVSMPASFVDEGVAAEWLNKLIADGKAAPEGSESQFIAGMLTMNADMVKAHAMKHPTTSNRSTVRGVIGYTDGSKPQAAGVIDWDMFEPDWVTGTADTVTRVAIRIKAARLGAVNCKGVMPTPSEKALVHQALESSPLGCWWVENATEISKRYNGWSLKSAVDEGLKRADGAPERGTGLAPSGSSNGMPMGDISVLPKTGGRLSWIDKELTHQGGAVGELLDMPTSDQIESLLGVYGCRAVFDEMRGKVAVHGLPKRFTKLDDIVTAIRELAMRYGAEWRKPDVTDFLKLLATGTGYHPALEWVRRIPWDGLDRFDDLLKTVEPEDDYRGMWRIGLHRWCMGAVRCLVQPEGMRGVPTIVFYAPAGGEGKDMWQSSLCPLEYQARPNGFDPGNLNWMLAALNGWLGIFPEITTQSKKADIEHVKAFLTADKDSYTSKYEMDVNDRLRRTVYLASTNESDYLADRTGTNRRFITIAVKSINYRHSIDMQQFWAQMMHTFEAAWAVSNEHVHRYWLEGEESRLLAEVNETHIVADLLEDQIRELWDFDDEAWQRDTRRTDWAVSVQAVAKRLDPDSAMNTSNIPQMFMKRIAREMSRLGVIRKQMRGKDGKTNYYLMPPSKPMKPHTAYTK